MTSAAAVRRAALAAAILTAACGPAGPDDSNVARGRGLKPAELTPAAEASIYDAATRAAFDVGPGLVLRAHPRRLSRTEGYDAGDSVPSDLLRALRSRGVVRGTCDPVRDAPRNTPRCNVPEAGYIVRASDVFRVGGDTVQIYFSAERFGAATGPRPEALRFEKAYQLVGSGDVWRVIREGRVHERSQ
jgi:hypothetical protein